VTSKAQNGASRSLSQIDDQLKGALRKSSAQWISTLVASNTSIEAALEAVKLLECIGKGGCEVGGRFAVQPVCLY
jgi:hypothetical protein